VDAGTIDGDGISGAPIDESGGCAWTTAGLHHAPAGAVGFSAALARLLAFRRRR
jgi:hypothetical protein